MSAPKLTYFPLVLSLLLGACAGGSGESEEADEGGDIGAPCELEEHCALGLTCDSHSGQGSCQEPHDH